MIARVMRQWFCRCQARARCVIMLDADNISPKLLPPLIEVLAADTSITAIRIYRNYASQGYQGWNGAGVRFGAIPVQVPRISPGKNAADMQMAIDALDLLHENRVDSFVLVSNDGDFMPLALRLRQSGKEVLGFGTRHAHEAFRASCTRFEYLSDLLPADRALRRERE